MDPEIKKAVDEIKDEVKKSVDEMKAGVVDDVKDQLKDGEKEAIAWYKQLPGFWKIVVVAALVLGYVSYEKWVAPVVAPVINVTVPPAPVVANAVKPEADKAAVEKADALRFVAKVIRHQTAKQLQTDGFNCAGGDAKPLSREAALNLVNQLEDEHIDAAIQLSGAVPAEGKILDTLASVLKWMVEHREQLKQIVEFIIMLLSVLA